MADFTANSYVPGQQVLNTYAPLPFEALAQAGAIKRKDVETNLEYEGAMADLMASVNARPGHEGYKNALMKNFTDQLNKISSKIYDKGDPTYGAEIRRLAKSFINNRVRQELESSFSNYNAMIEDYMKKQNDGKLAEFYYKQYREWTGGDVEKGDEINPFRYYGAKNYEDPAPDADAIFEGIKASGRKGEQEVLLPNGTKITVGSSSEGILPKDIRAIGDANIESFLQTKGGQYLKDYYESQGITGEKLLRSVSDFLYQRGMKNIYSKTEYKSGVDVWDSGRYGSGIDASMQLPDRDVVNPQYDKDTTEQLGDNMSMAYYKLKNKTKFLPNGQIASENGAIPYESYFINEVRKRYGLKNWTDKQISDSFTKLVENNINQQSSIWTTSMENRKAVTQNYLGTFNESGERLTTGITTGTKEVVNLETGTPGTMNDFMKKTKVSDGDLSKTVNKGFFRLGDYAGYDYYEIPKGEKTKYMAIRPEGAQYDAYAGVRAISKAKKQIFEKGYGVAVNPVNQVKYVVTPVPGTNPFSDGNLQVRIKEMRKDQNGNYHDTKDSRGNVLYFTEEELANEAQKMLQEANPYVNYTIKGESKKSNK